LCRHLQIDADPDPAYHFDADPDPSYHLDADPDRVYHFDAPNNNVQVFKVKMALKFAHLWMDGSPDFSLNPDPVQDPDTKLNFNDQKF
jgi:hypothetical protein